MQTSEYKPQTSYAHTAQQVGIKEIENSRATATNRLEHIKVQCDIDYLDLVYPDPRLSGLAGDQKVHYHVCAEGVASDLMWVWSQVER